MTSKRVLIVDDEPHVATVWAEALSKFGSQLQLLVAENAAQALRHAQSGAIDLLITDFRMPDMDGLTLSQMLRQSYPEMAVIMISAYDSVQLKQRAGQAGVQQFLSKPVSLVDIRRVVQDILGRMNAQTPAPAAPVLIQQEVSTQLKDFVYETRARCISLIRIDGNIIETAGNQVGLDLQVLSTLVAANFAAMIEIARILGNPRSFNAVNHESQDDNIYTCAVNHEYLLFVVFGKNVKSGTVWYYTKKLVEPLRALLREMPAEDERPTLDIDSALADALFGNVL